MTAFRPRSLSEAQQPARLAQTHPPRSRRCRTTKECPFSCSGEGEKNESEVMPEASGHTADGDARHEYPVNVFRSTHSLRPSAWLHGKPHPRHYRIQKAPRRYPKGFHSIIQYTTFTYNLGYTALFTTL